MFGRDISNLGLFFTIIDVQAGTQLLRRVVLQQGPHLAKDIVTHFRSLGRQYGVKSSSQKTPHLKIRRVLL